MSKTSPSQIDAHIGHRLRLLRIKLGKSLHELGDVIGVSFQQVQKYERGQNKIASSNLYIIADYLQSSVDYFFKGLDIDSFQLNDDNEYFDDSHKPSISDHELITLIKNFSKLRHGVRQSILALTKSLE